MPQLDLSDDNEATMSTENSLLAPKERAINKMNDDVTKFYFRSTNHHDEASLKQILQKLNRLEELEDNGYGHLKLLHICRICRQSGHSARTCELRSSGQAADSQT